MNLGKLDFLVWTGGILLMGFILGKGHERAENESSKDTKLCHNDLNKEES